MQGNDRTSFDKARLAPALALVVMAAFAPRPADAANSWLKVERVEAEPSLFPGYARVRVFVTAVQLTGGIISVDGASAWELQLGSRVQRKLPYLAGNFASTDDELAIAIVVETTLEFDEASRPIREALTQLVTALPRSAQVAIIGYDVDLHGGRRMTTRDRALDDLEQLDGSGDPGAYVLTRAVERADRALRRAEPSVEGAAMRKMIVVISDGKNVDMTPEAYRSVSRTAGRHGHPIHSIAFAPDGNKRALLGLGEMSKRSNGTFRWVRSLGGFAQSFKQLRDEIEQQYVLTFFVPREEVEGQRVHVRFGDLVSDPGVRVAELTCGAEACPAGRYCLAQQCFTWGRDDGRGVLGWTGLIGGIALGVLALFTALSLVLGLVMRRRHAQAVSAAALAHAAPDGPGEEPASPGQHASGVGPVMPNSGKIQPIGPAQPGTGRIQPSQPGRPSTGHPVQPERPGSGHPVQPARPSTGHPIQPSQLGHPGQQPGRPGPGHPGVGHGAPPGPGASLLILAGPLSGQRIPLHHGFMIGSAAGCHLQLAGDSYASGHHAQILMDTRGGFTLIDRGSTNGTFVNGVRATEKRLAHGMLIRVGATEARFLAQ